MRGRALIAFLIGIVMAYQGADQQRRFGAGIDTLDLLGIAILRRDRHLADRDRGRRPCLAERLTCLASRYSDGGDRGREPSTPRRPQRQQQSRRCAAAGR